MTDLSQRSDTVFLVSHFVSTKVLCVVSSSFNVSDWDTSSLYFLLDVSYSRSLPMSSQRSSETDLYFDTYVFLWWTPVSFLLCSNPCHVLENYMCFVVQDSRIITLISLVNSQPDLDRIWIELFRIFVSNFPTLTKVHWRVVLFRLWRFVKLWVVF